MFLGDLVDRGPNSPDVLRIVMRMVADGSAYAMLGNHDRNLRDWLRGRRIALRYGLAQTVEQLRGAEDLLHGDLSRFLDALPAYGWFDLGQLAVAHAGIRQDMLGRDSGFVGDFTLYGDVTGDQDDQGRPVAHDWNTEYFGATAIVYGHRAVRTPAWINNTICIDTGCVFGGDLTAIRWPERDIVAVTAKRAWWRDSP